MEFKIRRATEKNIEFLVHFRIMMFKSMGFTDQGQLETCRINSQIYFEKSIPKNEFYGWVVEVGSKIIGCGGFVIDKHPPSPLNGSGQIGYIMNIVIDPDFRGKGIATKLIDEIIKFAKSLEINVVSLHNTEMSVKIYEKLGFKDSNEMKLQLEL